MYVNISHAWFKSYTHRRWGAIHELASGGQESLYAKEVLPPLIRSPDSSFTMWWDIFQVPPPEHNYPDRNYELTEIYLRF